jgi:magnesium transporter
MRETKYDGVRWIDILKPTDKDIKFLADNFNFHHLLLEEIKTPTYHPVLESYETYLFLILHFPNFYRRTSQIQSVEIDFLITKDTLITVRYQDFPDLDAIFSEIEKNQVSDPDKTTGHLLHHLTKQLFSKMFPELDRIKESIDNIEDRIFKQFDDNIIEKIAQIKRQILDFVRALKPQKAVWDAAPEVALEFWGERIKPYVLDLIADYNRTLYFTETHREVLDSLHITSSSLLDNKRNYVIKILTIFTAFLLPLSFIASIYGMNLHLPFDDDPMTFWWLMSVMTFGTFLGLAWLKKNKWL